MRYHAGNNTSMSILLGFLAIVPIIKNNNRKTIRKRTESLWKVIGKKMESLRKVIGKRTEKQIQNQNQNQNQN